MKNVPLEMPLFVRNKGWTSIRPDLTYSRYNLNCSQLEEKDQCVILLDSNDSNIVSKKLKHSSNRTDNIKEDRASNLEVEVETKEKKRQSSVIPSSDDSVDEQPRKKREFKRVETDESFQNENEISKT